MMKRWLAGSWLGLWALAGGCAPTHEREAAVNGARWLEPGSFFAESEGRSIHYEVHGQGPTMMVLSNSWGIDVTGLRAVFEPLEERLTLVYFDPRGMGQSGPAGDASDMGLEAVRADFVTLHRHLGLERTHAIGWSNGAMNLLLLASEHPELLETAIFLHGAASYTEEDAARMAAEHPEMSRSFEALQVELRDEQLSDEEKTARMKRVWLEDFFPVSTANPDAAKPMLAEAFREARFSWRHALASPPTFDARDRLGSITARSLILAGVHDSFPLARAKEMRDGMPEAELVVFEESGHFAPLEEPQAFKEAVFAFLGV
jgi:proline iminopeptidase